MASGSSPSTKIERQMHSGSMLATRLIRLRPQVIPGFAGVHSLGPAPSTYQVTSRRGDLKTPTSSRRQRFELLVAQQVYESRDMPRAVIKQRLGLIDTVDVVAGPFAERENGRTQRLS